MALISSVTTAGLALNAQALRTSTPLNITRIELGSGFVNTLALVRARTGVVTQFTPRKESINPPVFAAGSTGQTVYFEQSTDTYVYTELAVFAGDVCIYYECDDAGAPIGQKAADSALQKLATFTYSNGDASLVVREFVSFPLAIPGEDNFGLVKYWNSTTADNSAVLSRAQILSLISGISAGLTPDQVIALIAGYVRDNIIYATQPEARAGTRTDRFMSPGLTTDHLEARIKIQSSDPTTGDAGLLQIWAVP